VNFVALKMLVGDRAKYLGIIMGLTFASLLITQQAGIFVGLMSRTYGAITDAGGIDIWAMESNVQFIDDVKPMTGTELFRIRGVDGVQWAMPMYRGLIKARLDNGNYQTCIITGIDDATLIGGPPVMVQGKLTDLRRADGIIVNDVGAQGMLARTAADGKTKVPLKIGDAIELNDHRAVVVGICRVARTFNSQPVVYTTYNRATSFAPQQFVQKTYNYFMENTGIPVNFGISVALGFLVGTAIAGQTFYQFTLENLRHFGALKAMGAGNRMVLKMIGVQAVLVGAIGYGLGVGIASLFGFLTRNTELSFRLPWWLMLGSAGAIIVISAIASMFSVWKVLKLEPAVVFK